jgi:hypothetical protein
MPALKSGIAALALVVGVSSPALAQGQGQAKGQKTFPGGANGSYPATQTPGNLSEYYGMTPNFANYGLSGSYPGFGGYGYSAYGPGAQFGAHYPASPASKVPPFSTKPSTTSSRKQTGKPASPGNVTNRGVPLPRKGL